MKTLYDIIKEVNFAELKVIGGLNNCGKLIGISNSLLERNSTFKVVFERGIIEINKEDIRPIAVTSIFSISDCAQLGNKTAEHELKLRR